MSDACDDAIRGHASSREDTAIILSIGGVEFRLTPSPTEAEGGDEDGRSAIYVQRMHRGEAIIDLNGFVGTLHVTSLEPNASAPYAAAELGDRVRGEHIAHSPMVENPKRKPEAGAGNSGDSAVLGPAAKKLAMAKVGNSGSSDGQIKLTPTGKKPERKRAVRRNWGADDTMKNAVEEWDRIRHREDAPSKSEFARSRGISPKTFFRYVVDDPAKRKSIGCSAGRRSFVSDETVAILAKHYGENGIYPTTTEVIDTLMQLQPELTRMQATNYVQNTWRGKTGVVMLPRQARREPTAARLSTHGRRRRGDPSASGICQARS